MIEKTISDIEAKLRAESIGAESKTELLRLLTTLKTEIATLEKTHTDVREKQKLLQHSVDELRSSVQGFEQSHPKLIQAVQGISNILANFGV